MGQSGRTGFGLGQIDPRVNPTNVNRQLLAAEAGDTTALLQLIERHLRDLSERYAEPVNFSPQQINIVASGTQFTARLDFSTQPHNSLLISVTAGTLNILVGDYSGVSQAVNPHAQIGAGTTQQLFFGLAGRVYTLINPSAVTNLVACVTPIAL